MKIQGKSIKNQLCWMYQNMELLQKCSEEVLGSKHTEALQCKTLPTKLWESQCHISTKQSPSIRMKRSVVLDLLPRLKKVEWWLKTDGLVVRNRPKGCVLICVHHLNSEMGHYLQIQGKCSCIREKEREKEGGREQKRLNK